MPEISVELFGIVRKLPMKINLMAGNLDVYELLEPVHDETIIALFGLVEQKLEIAFDQFFAGCAMPAQLGPHRRVIGFVRRGGVLWTHSRRNGRFELDSLDIAHIVRDKDDIILAPTSKPSLPQVLPPIFRAKTTFRF